MSIHKFLLRSYKSPDIYLRYRKAKQMLMHFNDPNEIHTQIKLDSIVINMIFSLLPNNQQPESLHNQNVMNTVLIIICTRITCVLIDRVPLKSPPRPYTFLIPFNLQINQITSSDYH